MPDGIPGGDHPAHQGRCALRGALVAVVGAAVIVGTAAAVPGALADPSDPAANEDVAAEAGTGARGLEPAVAFAMDHVGDAYALGGDGPHRWDCSGLVRQAYRRAGVRLPRIAADQYRATARISRKALRRGDLLFWSSDGRASGVHHVGVYLGGGRYIEAARPGTKVRISAFSRYSPNLYGRPVAG